MAEKSNVPYDTVSRQSVETKPLFNKCCFCFPLRTGCFILGYLNLIVNFFRTMSTVSSFVIVAVFTNGFDHFDSPDDMRKFSLKDPYAPEKIDESMLIMQLGFLMTVLLIATLMWMAVNIACLVGLHKKRPGPIRVYVGFATAGLILDLLGFIYIATYRPRTDPEAIITKSLDLGLTAYFILVYCVYAMKLEREREAEIAEPAPVNNAFIYPTKLDKNHLVLA